MNKMLNVFNFIRQGGGRGEDNLIISSLIEFFFHQGQKQLSKISKGAYLEVNIFSPCFTSSGAYALMPLLVV